MSSTIQDTSKSLEAIEREATSSENGSASNAATAGTTTTAAAALPTNPSPTTIVSNTYNFPSYEQFVAAEKKKALERSLNGQNPNLENSVEDALAEKIENILKECEAFIANHFTVMEYLNQPSIALEKNVRYKALLTVTKQIKVLSKIKSLAEQFQIDELFWLIKTEINSTEVKFSKKTNQRLKEKGSEDFRELLRHFLIDISPYRSALLCDIQKKGYFKFKILDAQRKLYKFSMGLDDEVSTHTYGIQSEHASIIRRWNALACKLCAAYKNNYFNVEFTLLMTKEMDALKEATKKIGNTFEECTKLYVPFTQRIVNLFGQSNLDNYDHTKVAYADAIEKSQKSQRI